MNKYSELVCHCCVSWRDNNSNSWLRLINLWKDPRHTISQPVSIRSRCLADRYLPLVRLSLCCLALLVSLIPIVMAAGGDGSSGFVLKGVDPGDRSGSSVSSADDINGDGIDDLIVGANGADPNGKSGAGESYVVFGRTTGFPAAFELTSLLPAAGGDGSNGFVLNGVQVSESSGCSVSGVGDINGDGINDLIIGAYWAHPNGKSGAGASYVVFGRTTGFPASFELTRLYPVAGGDGSSGFVLKGVDALDHTGNSVSSVGDINGDGIDDLIIGAYDADPNGKSGAGESYVVFGRTTGFPGVFELSSLFPAAGGDGSSGFVLNGVNATDSSGISVSGAGDINGDGIDDLIIGAISANPNGKVSAGASYVVFGRTTGFPATFELTSLYPAAGGDGSSGFVLKGVDAHDYSGWVSSAGDINGDGIDDLIIGASDADPNGRSDAGESYVVFGRTTGFPAIFELSSLLPPAGGDGSNGFVLKGIDEGGYSGFSVSGAGDINGDGIDDLIIGAYFADPYGKTLAGASYVVFGRATGFPATFDLASLYPAAGGDGSYGFVMNGLNSGDFLGVSVSNTGDINGDSIDDLLIGASAEPDENRTGESYVVFGRTTGFPAIFELSSLFP